MNQFKFDLPYKEKPAGENFIRPEHPEQPLIHVRENRESGCFEAVFAFELAGVTRREYPHEKSCELDDKPKAIVEQYRSSLLSAISIGQRIDIVYSCGRSKQDNINFDLKIIGHSKGETSDKATKTACQLRENLNVILGTVKNNYCFTPINEIKKLKKEEIEERWLGVVRPVGVAVNTDGHTPVGFLRQRSRERNIQKVIVVPHNKNKGVNALDSVSAASIGRPSEVKVLLSITPFKLSEDELQNVASALKWLRNGEPKQISYHQEIKGGIEDGEILNGLVHSLNLWLKNPSGVSVTCTAISAKPIPSSFLTLIGNELFNSPLSISMEKNEDKNAVLVKQDSRARAYDILDLQNCINSDSVLPALFPGVATLVDCGAKRLFMQPANNIPNDGILLGHVGDGAAAKEVHFSRADRSRHCYIVGATGTGKSTLLYNMIVQDIKNGEGVAVIDPHGDLYQQVLESIPKHRVDDVVLIDPCDFEYSVGINFLECTGTYKSVQMNFITNEMIKIFDRLYDLGKTGGPVFEQYTRNALLLLMDSEYTGATLMDIPMIFEDEEFRAFLKAKCKNPIVENFWSRQAEKAGGDGAIKNMGPYITSKLNQFTANALLSPIIGQSKSTIDFREIMDHGKILLVNLSKGLLGELDTQLLGMLIIGKIFSSAMGRVSQRYEDRRPMFLYVDEFQNFTTDTVAYLLSEARKFGLYLTLANQNLAQLSANSGRQSVLDAVLGNVGTTLILRLGALDADKMDIYTRPELQAQDLQNLPDFHAAGRLLVKNCPSRPFVFKTLAGLDITDQIHADDVINISRNKYASPVRQVEEGIKARRSMYKYCVET